ncbi:MAG: DUF4293 domain-containing protein [Bacteroidaceae bacterium]|nr:DUF4293 domain-containing protein [Bacteroidaceae bacterium]MCF0186586.1 DUF4293 domain-containing protein [Bacteroidaceae bacterium]
MIQRIQTLYLLAVLVLVVACEFCTVGRFIGAEGELLGELGNLTMTQNGEATFTPWAMFALLLCIALITALAICLFRKRMRQIRLIIFSSILLVGYYLIYGWFVYAYLHDGVSFRPSLTASFPLLALIFNYLAARAIGKDEFLVRSLDRLR